MGFWPGLHSALVKPCLQIYKELGMEERRGTDRPERTSGQSAPGVREGTPKASARG